MEDPEDHRGRADRDQVLVREPRGRFDFPAPEERAVLASEILEKGPDPVDEDPGVPAGNQVVIDPERRALVAADHVLSGSKGDFAISPDKTEGRRVGADVRLVRKPPRERVADRWTFGGSGAPGRRRPASPEARPPGWEGSRRRRKSRPQDLWSSSLETAFGRLSMRTASNANAFGETWTAFGPQDLASIGVENAAAKRRRIVSLDESGVGDLVGSLDLSNPACVIENGRSLRRRLHAALIEIRAKR